MATYLDIGKIARVEDFQTRCRMATWNLAKYYQDLDASAEPPNLVSVFPADYPRRRDWAYKVITAGADVPLIGLTGEALALQCLRNADVRNATATGGVDNTCTDAQLDTAVAQVATDLLWLLLGP